MKVGELFDIFQGTIDNVDLLSKGPYEVVSATTRNNGVVGYVKKLNVAHVSASTKSPVLTIARNGAPCFATVHACDLYLTSEAFALVPNDHKFWGADKLAKLTAVGAYIRKQRWRFGFGRKANGRIACMYLDIVAVEAIAGSIVQAKPKLKSITSADVAALLSKLPNGVAIRDLFEVVPRKSLSGDEAADSGDIPLVSTTENNNGVHGFVPTQGADFLVPGRGISVAKNGKPMVSRIQLHPYAKTSDMAPLTPKPGSSYTEKELAILAALIESQDWRYSYGRKANWGRMGPQVIT